MFEYSSNWTNNDIAKSVAYLVKKCTKIVLKMYLHNELSTFVIKKTFSVLDHNGFLLVFNLVGINSDRNFS